MLILLLPLSFLGCRREATLVHGAEWEVPTGNRGPQSVRLREVWRTSIDADFGVATGMIEWPDEKIWIADGRSGSIWEVQSDGSRPRTVSWHSGENAAQGINGIVRVGSDGLAVFGRDEVASGARGNGVDRRAKIPNIWTWGRLGLPDGGFILSGGAYEGDPGHGYSVHRYDQFGDHVQSWHPEHEHADWRAVRRLSGGPVSVTGTGDLLVSDVAPFRITRYSQMDGSTPVLVVEDAEVISPTELERALAPDRPNITYQERWNRSRYVGETINGNILNVAWMYSARGQPFSLWTVVTPQGVMLASTSYENSYNVWGRTKAGEYLASDNTHAFKLEILLEPVGVSNTCPLAVPAQEVIAVRASF